MLVGVDTDTVALLARKLQDHNRDKFFDSVDSFSHWKKLSDDARTAFFEDFLEEKNNSHNTTRKYKFTSALDVARILEKDINQVYKEKRKIARDEINSLPPPKRLKLKTKKTEKILDLYNSFRPAVRLRFEAERTEQVALSSDSEDNDTETLEVDRKPSRTLCETSREYFENEHDDKKLIKQELNDIKDKDISVSRHRYVEFTLTKIRTPEEINKMIFLPPFYYT